MKTTAKMQNTITALAAKHGMNLTCKGTVLRLDMPHFDRLVVEVLHANLVNVAHVFEPHSGIRMADPGVVFFTGHGPWVPIEVNQRIGGYRIYATLSEELDDIVAFLPHEQADLANFVEMWAQAIRDQGWLEDGVPYIEPALPF